MTAPEVLQGLLKIVAAGLDAWEQHEAELAAAKAQVNQQATEDLAAVTGQPVPVPQAVPVSFDSDLP